MTRARVRHALDAPSETGSGGRGFEYLDSVLAAYAATGHDQPARARLREQLVTGYLPVARHIARRYASRGEPLADLEQVGCIGLMNAIERFDPELGHHFLSYAVPTITGEIRRHFRDRTWAMRVPRRLKELGVSMRGVTGELTQELGRAPRPSDLARRLGVDVEEIVEALRAEAGHHTSTIDAGAGPDGQALSERLGAEDELLEGVENVEAVRPLLDRLPARERRIVLLRFYGGRTQSQIAEEIGISQMHVSRLLARTLAGMRRELSEESRPE